MTDITELTQREKFEAWLSPRWSMEKFIDDDGEEQYVEDYVQGAWMGFSAANTELVEALELARNKAADWEEKAAINYAERTAMIQHITELESRTVKLPDLRQIVSGDRYVWSDGVYNYSQDVKVALAAAGIKVEAE
ncbi:hypothetical protein B6J05_14540 [Klebsiella quasipneumoniae]|nr:hypothetical protein B6J05_14540 [Klebsiella quasipneumoniae]